MNWHARFTQQAKWTHDLRTYLFQKSGLDRAGRVLEVGCGTGAILAGINSPTSLYGLDLDPGALTECRVHAPAVCLACGDALSLPYPDRSFDIVYCHFLLLWVKDPLQAVREMARVGGNILALAEPDYSARVDKPNELARLGEWQAESLRRQGADPSFGARLAETFHQAGIKLIETGPIQSAALPAPVPQAQVSESKGQDVMRSDVEWENEWETLESDLAGIVPAEEIRKMKSLDEKARERGERVLHVPTYFAWGHRYPAPEGYGKMEV